MSHDHRTAIAHVRVWGEPIDDPKNVVSADHGCTAAKQKYRAPSWTHRWPGARRCITSLEHTGEKEGHVISAGSVDSRVRTVRGEE
jgi:hypothetical protein